MGKIKVRGAVNTSDLVCNICGSWFAHWKKLAGKDDGDKVYCCHPDHHKVKEGKAYTEKVEANSGAHVVEDEDIVLDGEPEDMFIIPVCDKHNITMSTSIWIDEKWLKSADPCED